ncbi:hypothetical protein KIPB_017115, partial [Kipferlia bialata]|eukprot:g17115.t1
MTWDKGNAEGAYDEVLHHRAFGVAITAPGGERRQIRYPNPMEYF